MLDSSSGTLLKPMARFLHDHMLFPNAKIDILLLHTLHRLCYSPADDETLPDAEGLPNTKSEPLRLPGLTVESEKHKEFTVVSDRSDHSEPITGEMEKVTLLTTDPSAIKSAMEFNLAEDGPSKLVSTFATYVIAI